MRSVRMLLALTLVLSGASAAYPQGQEPVGPFVVDVRGLMAGLPTDPGWVPTLPANTVVPSRGFGLEGGGHVYPVRLGPARIGLGVAFSAARGSATSTIAGTPDVVTKTATVAPQVSFNFGHRLGWSYLSAGYGGAKASSESSAVGGAVAAANSDSGWVGAVNVGGGARWFLTEHLGVGFDARWHRLPALDPSATGTGAPRATLFHLAVGVSLH